MPARVPVRSPVHIFSTPTMRTARSDVRALSVPRCRALAPPAHELSTLTIGTSPRPPLRSQAWPRTQPWSFSRPPVALATMTSDRSAGSTPASAMATETAWCASCSGVMSRRLMSVMPIPVTATESVAMGRVRCGDLDGGPTDPRPERGLQRLEVLQRIVGGHHDHDVLRARPPVGVDGRGAVVGRPADEVPGEGARRDAVERGEPLAARGEGAFGVPDAEEHDDGPRDVGGRAPGRHCGVGQPVEPGPVVLRREEHRDPAVP